MKLDWDDIWQGFAILVLATIFTSIMIYSFAPKHTVRYELINGSYGIPTIHRDVENALDETVRLSKEITWPQAVKMTDSLNATLYKYPIK